MGVFMYTQVEVRYAAFSALRAITGVANRSQLHRLLVKLGLLQHVRTDEVEDYQFERNIMQN